MALASLLLCVFSKSVIIVLSITGDGNNFQTDQNKTGENRQIICLVSALPDPTLD